MTTGRVDANMTIGMTAIYAGLDLEQALAELVEAGFEGAEVFVGHLGPRVIEAPVLEAHAAAAAQLMGEVGLRVSTLNCTGRLFDPFGSDELFELTAADLAHNLRLAAAIGSPRVLIWDGELDDPGRLRTAPARLAEVIAAGRERSGLAELPEVTVELHPNTFAFKHRLHEETASALVGIGAGVCLDFCHAGVAFGAGFPAVFSTEFLGSVSHVHFADSDCTSEQLHFPLGSGRVDLEAATGRLEASGLAAAWDLFGWPSPRRATAAGMQLYRDAVRRIGLTHDDGEGAAQR